MMVPLRSSSSSGSSNSKSGLWKDRLLKVSLVVNFFFVASWMTTQSASSHVAITNGEDKLSPNNGVLRGEDRTWHGGTPAADHQGSCWCSEDEYCICTPSLSVDLILVSEEEDDTYLWLVQRQDNDKLAAMGGSVDLNESVEEAVHRELKEEMGIVLDHETESGKEQLQLLGVYSDPRRDNRRRTATVVFVVKLARTIQPKASDDAKDVKKISVKDIEEYDYFSDHKTFLLDFRESLEAGKKGLATTNSLKSDLEGDKLKDAQVAVGMARNVCI